MLRFVLMYRMRLNARLNCFSIRAVQADKTIITENQDMLENDRNRRL